MNIQYSYEIKKDEYEEIFRTHLKFKFRIRRSMYMSLALYIFGLTMQYGIGMDFAFINTLVFFIVIFAIAVNLFADFYLPKKAYHNLVSQEQHQGTLIINQEGVSATHGKIETNYQWELFNSFTENEYAFLLYRKDVLFVLPKQFDSTKLDEVRKFIKDRIHR